MKTFIRKDPSGYITTFNQETGFSIRTDLPDGKEPFMGSMPELLDICITKYCKGPFYGDSYHPCSYCYMDSTPDKKWHIQLSEYIQILNSVKGHVFQIALGGGEPTLHPNFIDILRITKEQFEIIPNYTTNGSNLTPAILEASKKYCGAVAVSNHEGNQCIDSCRKLIKSGIKTNIHYVVRKFVANKEGIRDLERGSYPWDVIKGLNAIIFLLHKPMGRANIKDQPLPEEAIEFVKTVTQWDKGFKIGFDACFAPALVQTGIDPTFYDYCDGGRFSGFIDWDMNMFPCSFAGQDPTMGMSLREHSFKEIWNSVLFDGFRNKFKSRCLECAQQTICAGGCPLHKNIAPCNKPERTW